MKSVVIIARDSVPVMNPAGIIAYRYAEMLSNYGCNVTLLSFFSNDENLIPNEYINENIKIKSFHIKNKFDIIIHLKCFFFLLKCFLLGRLDILITHTNPLYTHWYGIILKFITFGTVRWMASFTDPYSNSLFENRKLKSLGKKIRIIEEFFVKKCSNNMVFVTNSMRDFMLKGNEGCLNKSIVIPFFYLNSWKNKFDSIDYSSVNKINFIHAGAIYGNRNASNVLESFKIVDGYELDIYGDVKNLDVNHYRECISFFGSIKYIDLIEKMKSYKYVLIIDSFFDGNENPYMPSKVIEAMYCNKKILGVTEPGTELDLFLKKTNNISVANDVNAIVNAIYALDYNNEPDYSNFSDDVILSELKVKLDNICL